MSQRAPHLVFFPTKSNKAFWQNANSWTNRKQRAQQALHVLWSFLDRYHARLLSWSSVKWRLQGNLGGRWREWKEDHSRTKEQNKKSPHAFNRKPLLFAFQLFCFRETGLGTLTAWEIPDALTCTLLTASCLSLTNSTHDITPDRIYSCSVRLRATLVRAICKALKKTYPHMKNTPDHHVHVKPQDTSDH